jgi:hypothetical protein
MQCGRGAENTDASTTQVTKGSISQHGWLLLEDCFDHRRHWPEQALLCHAAGVTEQRALGGSERRLQSTGCDCEPACGQLRRRQAPDVVTSRITAPAWLLQNSRRDERQQRSAMLMIEGCLWLRASLPSARDAATFVRSLCLTRNSSAHPLVPAPAAAGIPLIPKRAHGRRSPVVIKRYPLRTGAGRQLWVGLQCCCRISKVFCNTETGRHVPSLRGPATLFRFPLATLLTFTTS